MFAPPRYLIGAMSGTSADGVDVALTEISGHGIGMSAKLIKHHAVPYESALRSDIFQARAKNENGWDRIADLTRRITLTYVQAVSELMAGRTEPIAAVAAHGQTFFHGPPNTIQVFDPSLLAYETGYAVVSDFRRADCAAGGQGAPLVPFADYILYRHPTKNRVLLNIGGIANLTWLKAGGTIDDVIAFDTGPGNCVSDDRCRITDRFFDAGGKLAARGTVDESHVARFCKGDYVRKVPPKSTDGPAMIELFNETESPASKQATSLENALATACAITAETIARVLRSPLPRPGGEGQGEGPSAANGATTQATEAMRPSPQPSPPGTGERGIVDEVLVSGGGVRNARIMRELRERMPETEIIILPDEMAQAKEAVAFALLGAATLDGEPSNVPSVTGAARRVILGSITPKP